VNRLPSVTTGVRRYESVLRAALASAGIVLALVSMLLPRDAPAAATPASLARLVAPDAVAVRVPHGWLAAPPPRLASGDRVDLLAARSQDRAAISVAGAARILAADDDALVIEVAADDAAALAVARAGGYVLVVLLRPAP